MEDRVVTQELLDGEVENIRPDSLEEYRGQQEVKDNMKSKNLVYFENLLAV